MSAASFSFEKASDSACLMLGISAGVVPRRFASTCRYASSSGLELPPRWTAEPISSSSIPVRVGGVRGVLVLRARMLSYSERYSSVIIRLMLLTFLVLGRQPGFDTFLFRDGGCPFWPRAVYAAVILERL